MSKPVPKGASQEDIHAHLVGINRVANAGIATIYTEACCAWGLANYLHWFEAHGITVSFRNGCYVLDETPTTQEKNHGGDQNESSTTTTGTTDRDNDKTVNGQTRLFCSAITDYRSRDTRE